MRRFKMSRSSAMAALVAAAVLGSPFEGNLLGVGAAPVAAQSESRQARELDKLFADLKQAPTQEAADKIVGRIWDIWLRSGRDDTDVMMSRVVANTAGQHYGLALMLLDEVIEIAPEFAEAWNKRAALRYRMGQFPSAVEDIETALKLEPRHFGALAIKSAILADMSKWQDALTAYRAALAINPHLTSRHKVLPELERLAAQAR
ncbi:MAG: tetratricopeptide repeat protein [Rhodospirillales bacterium]|nr:tetratricopeptide repeat protein [Rhodospirillales bacterium]